MVLILISALYFYSNLLSEVVSPIVAHKGIGSAPTQQTPAAAFDLGDVARAVERYLPSTLVRPKASDPRNNA